MSSVVEQTPVVKPVDLLVARLEAEGFVPGAPAHISAEAQRIDATACRLVRCPVCRRRGLKARPFHAGRRYKVVGECECGHGEEF